MVSFLFIYSFGFSFLLSPSSTSKIWFYFWISEVEMVVSLFSFLFFVLDVRASTSRTRERMPTRLSLATRGQEANTDVVVTDSKISESRLATPSSGGRISFKGSSLPIPVGNPSDSAKLRRIMQDTRPHNVQLQKPRQTWEISCGFLVWGFCYCGADPCLRWYDTANKGKIHVALRKVGSLTKSSHLYTL